MKVASMTALKAVTYLHIDKFKVCVGKQSALAAPASCPAGCSQHAGNAAADVVSYSGNGAADDVCMIPEAIPEVMSSTSPPEVQPTFSQVGNDGRCLSDLDNGGRIIAPYCHSNSNEETQSTCQAACASVPECIGYTMETTQKGYCLLHLPQKNAPSGYESKDCRNQGNVLQITSSTQEEGKLCYKKDGWRRLGYEMEEVLPMVVDRDIVLV